LQVSVFVRFFEGIVECLFVGPVFKYPIFVDFLKFHLQLVSSMPKMHHIEGISLAVFWLKFEKIQRKRGLEIVSCKSITNSLIFKAVGFKR